MNNDKIYTLKPEEQEYLFSGVRSDDYYTLEIFKGLGWTSNRNKWVQAAEKHPDKISIVSENDDYISFKINKSAVKLPTPNMVSEVARQKASERFKAFHKKRKEEKQNEIKEINND